MRSENATNRIWTTLNYSDRVGYERAELNIQRIVILPVPFANMLAKTVIGVLRDFSRPAAR